MTGATAHAVAAYYYPSRTLTATPTCSSHSNTALYETYVAKRSRSGGIWMYKYRKQTFYFDGSNLIVQVNHLQKSRT